MAGQGTSTETATPHPRGERVVAQCCRGLTTPFPILQRSQAGYSKRRSGKKWIEPGRLSWLSRSTYSKLHPSPWGSGCLELHPCSSHQAPARPGGAESACASADLSRDWSEHAGVQDRALRRDKHLVTHLKRSIWASPRVVAICVACLIPARKLFLPRLD